VGKVTEPVDTIFIKSVREDGPAYRAGLCVGTFNQFFLNLPLQSIRVHSQESEVASIKSGPKIRLEVEAIPVLPCIGFLNKSLLDGFGCAHAEEGAGVGMNDEN